MLWNIHFRKDATPGYRAVSTLEIALKEACELLDGGAEVSEIASSGGSKCIGPDELRLICAERKTRNLH